MTGEPTTILLVEDNPDHAELVLRCLADHSFASKVVHVRDGETALDYLLHRGVYSDPLDSPRPRLVVLDLRLPKLDGRDVLRLIKTTDEVRGIPVVILTSSRSVRDLSDAYGNHANSYLVKPMRFSEFSGLIPGTELLLACAQRVFWGRFMILLVEDDTAHIELIQRAFSTSSVNYELTTVGTLVEAKARIDAGKLDLVVADFLLPDGDCLALLPGDLSEADCPVIVLTSHGNEQIAVDAMKAGAMDYVVKSQSSLEDLPHIVSRTLREWNHIVERRKLEAQVLEAQKLEAVGTLAAGIAHDFNNLLMGVQGNVSLVLMDLEPSNPHVRNLKNVEELVKSGANLTRQLLGFARGGRYEVTAVDINRLIRET